MSNPYQPPGDAAETASTVAGAPGVLRALRGPSVGLIILAGLQLLGMMLIAACFLAGCTYVMITTMDEPELGGEIISDAFNDVFEEPRDVLSFVGSVASTISCFVIFRGARGMRVGRNYRRSLIAAILSCIPLLSPIAYFGIPFGIWALVVLRRPEIRAEFAARESAARERSA